MNKTKMKRIVRLFFKILFVFVNLLSKVFTRVD